MVRLPRFWGCFLVFNTRQNSDQFQGPRRRSSFYKNQTLLKGLKTPLYGRGGRCHFQKALSSSPLIPKFHLLPSFFFNIKKPFHFSHTLWKAIQSRILSQLVQFLRASPDRWMLPIYPGGKERPLTKAAPTEKAAIRHAMCPRGCAQDGRKAKRNKEKRGPDVLEWLQQP